MQDLVDKSKDNVLDEDFEKCLDDVNKEFEKCLDDVCQVFIF
jgi:hypothetical protein